jgi:hypothetical protein
MDGITWSLYVCNISNQVEHCRKCKKDDKKNVVEYCPEHKKAIEELEKKRPIDW